jgi:cell division protein FtsB
MKISGGGAGRLFVKIPDLMRRTDDQETTTIWQAVSRCLLWAVTMVCVCICLALFKPQMNRRAKLDAELADWRQKKDEARATLAESERKLKWLVTDPAYLEVHARDVLDLAKDGETVFHFPPVR